MFEIKGKFTTASVFADAVEIDNQCISQITKMCNIEQLKNCHIAMMPDAHPGKGCMVGTTIKLGNYVNPSWIGDDIGCGILAIEIPEQLYLDFEEIDDYISSTHDFLDKPNIFHKLMIEKLKCFEYIKKDSDKILKSLGTLGSGNHFIEIAVSKKNDNSKWLIIHSGSRLMGKAVSQYYQRLTSPANNHCLDLNSETGRNYLSDMAICVDFASMNRRYIAKSILEFIVKDNWYNDGCLNVYIDSPFKNQFEFGFDNREVEIRSQGYETVHNYIDDEKILRKGAIAAYKHQKVIIPINMAEGSIIGYGRENPDCNFSAPHGAGRMLSRADAKLLITLNEYKESMSSVYTSSVCQSTISECPMAYKPIEEIIENMVDSVYVADRLIPLYNYKPH